MINASENGTCPRDSVSFYSNSISETIKKVTCPLLLEPSAEQLINPPSRYSSPLYHDLVVRHHPDLDINVCVCLFEFTNIQIHPSTTKH